MTGRRQYPDGYHPIAFCRECGRDFAGDSYFDQHRVGLHDYTFLEGLDRDPPVENGRRCRETEELRELGLRPMTDDEMRASRRHRHRAGFGVEMWFNPAAGARITEALQAQRGLRDAQAALGEGFH